MSDYALRVWARPEPEGIYSIGADPSEGLAHGDDAAAEVIDCRNGEQVAELQGTIDPFSFAEMLFLLGTWYNRALVGIENNKDGGANRRLFELGYRNMYWERANQGKAYDEATPTLGYNMNLRTRPLLVAQGRRSIEDGSVTLRSRHLLGEFETFALEMGKFQAIRGGHDDLVMAYLIACEMMRVVLLSSNLQGAQQGIGPGQDVDMNEKELSRVDRHVKQQRAKAPAARPDYTSTMEALI